MSIEKTIDAYILELQYELNTMLFKENKYVQQKFYDISEIIEDKADIEKDFFNKLTERIINKLISRILTSSHVLFLIRGICFIKFYSSAMLLGLNKNPVFREIQHIVTNIQLSILNNKESGTSSNDFYYDVVTAYRLCHVLDHYVLYHVLYIYIYIYIRHVYVSSYRPR